MSKKRTIWNNFGYTWRVEKLKASHTCYMQRNKNMDLLHNSYIAKTHANFKFENFREQTKIQQT